MTQPTKWSMPLGSGADVQDLPNDDLKFASFSKIFPQITQVPLSAGGVAPRRIDFNSLFKLLADNIYYYQNGGVFEYSATADYEKGALVRYNDKIYLCIQDNSALNLHNPDDMDYWLRVALNNELADYLPLVGGNITGNLSVQNKNVVRTVNDIEADVNGNVVIENQDSTSLIPNQLVISPVPMTDANLHLLDGALLSGSGAYSAYVAMMADLYNADPTATCWTDEASWQASVTTYGECGKFVYDSVNNTLRLPKLKSFIQATTTASELGSLVEAGAPNVTGNTGSFDWANNLANGAFFENNPLSFTYVGSSGTASPISFDASRSSSVYGNSNTIQPQAIKYYFYIVVGTISKTDIQIDIDNVMTDLALKADTDLGNTSPSQTFKDMSISWALPDYSAGISQSGGVAITASSDGWLQVRTDDYNSFSYFTLNGVTLAISGVLSTQVTSSWNIFPINKGDIYKVDFGRTSSVNTLIFYPCKGV